MITQGYPLWATDADGNTYAVVGWVWRGADVVAFPVLVGDCGVGTYMEDDRYTRVWTFTTERPAAGDAPDGADAYWDVAHAHADLARRLATLADDLERTYPHYGAASHAVQRIRQELAK